MAVFDARAADVVPVIEAVQGPRAPRPVPGRGLGRRLRPVHRGPTAADRDLAAPVPDQRGSGIPLRRAGLDREPCPRPVRAGVGAGRSERDADTRSRDRKAHAPPALQDTPGLAVVIDSFEQRTQHPKRRQRAYYSGKKKAHAQEPSGRGRALRSGRVRFGSGAVGGHPVAQDVTVVHAPPQERRWDRGLGLRGDRCVAPVGIGCVAASSLAGRTARPRTGSITVRSAGAGSWSNTRSVGGAGSGRWRT